MSITETIITLVVILAIIGSAIGVDTWLSNIWQNYYIGKKYHLWIEVGIILLVVLGFGLAILGFTLGGFNE